MSIPRTAFRCLLATVLLAGGGHAEERGDARLDQALRDLASDLRAVCLAAHPDDEDSATLALLRRKYGVETTVFCFTDGAGGQNEISGDLYADLARIRRRETITAAASTGARVRFLGFPDFGYSRSSEETFERWGGKEEVVRRIVRGLRAVRPQVVITNHDTKTGHGHHQAVGIAALEAFVAAADPERFLGEGEPWAVSKLFVACEKEAATALPDVGEVDRVRGISYAEMGLNALKMHRSQGGWDWVKVPAGPLLRPYRLAKNRLEEPGKTLLGGLPIPAPEWLTAEWRRGPRPEILERILTEKPGRSDPAAVDRALAAALTVDLRVTVPTKEVITPGGSYTVEWTLVNGGHETLAVRSVDGEPPGERGLVPGGAFSGKQNGIPAPDEDTEIRRRVVLALGDREFAVTASADVAVTPRVQLHLLPFGRLLRPAVGGGNLVLLFRNNTTEEIIHTLDVEFPDARRFEVESIGELTLPPYSDVPVSIPIGVPVDVSPGTRRVVISYGDIQLEDMVRVLDVGVPHILRIGVVTTFGEEPLLALRAFGVEAKPVTDAMLSLGDLDAFDAIWMGIRPYLARPILHRVNYRLLDWVERGGTLIVNYNKVREWKPEYAPYPLEIGRDRVTREDAEVDFVRDDLRVLNRPNEVTEQDFEGWVQERGLYFPSDFDHDAYAVVLRTGDPEHPLLPGLLLAKYGRGTYVYTTFVWYRQLRILNPAALKMLANLVSIPWVE